MKFRLRRHRPVEPLPPLPPLSQDELFAVVHERIARFVGSDGAWVVTRRSHDDRDAIFHGMLARSLAHEISAALHAEQLRAGVAESSSPLTEALPAMRASTEPVTAASFAAGASGGSTAEQAAGRIASGEPTVEPAALGWSPAPIAVWADSPATAGTGRPTDSVPIEPVPVKSVPVEPARH